MAKIRSAQEFIDQDTTIGVTNTLCRNIVLPSTFTGFSTYDATLEGNGYNIDVDIQTPEEDDVSLFGVVSGTITEVSVSGIVSGRSGVGAIASSTLSTATITKCRNQAFVTGIGWVGGIVGRSGVSVDFSNCYNEGTIVGLERIGGVVGQNNATNTIDKAHSVGLVKRIDDVTGLSLHQDEISALINALYGWSVYGTNNLAGWTIDLTGNTQPDVLAMAQAGTLNGTGWNISVDGVITLDFSEPAQSGWIGGI